MYCTSPRRDGKPYVHSLGSARRGPIRRYTAAPTIDTGIYHTLAQWHIGFRVSKGRAGDNLVSPLANDLRYLYQVYREHGGKSH